MLLMAKMNIISEHEKYAFLIRMQSWNTALICLKLKEKSTCNYTIGILSIVIQSII